MIKADLRIKDQEVVEICQLKTTQSQDRENLSTGSCARARACLDSEQCDAGQRCVCFD